MMDNGRHAEASFSFNGANVTTILRPYLESVKYTDVASGESDQLDISLQNVNGYWLNEWYPVKGDKVVGSFILHDWNGIGEDETLPLGIFTMDDIKFSGGPMTAKFGCVAVPNDESFHTRERTKTWQMITVQGIGTEIAGRYGLQFNYSGEDIMVESLEQSDKTDSSFLYELCDTYGLSMKVYADAITIYNQTEIEQLDPVAVLNRQSFIDDKWDYTDTLAGIYTGARVSYKSGTDENEEISIYVGLIDEDAPGSRVLRISGTVDSVEDAHRKAAAQVNKSNQDATTLSGNIWPNFSICAGVTVMVQDMGAASGKYFVDKSTITLSGSGGTVHNIEMHKCQERL